MRRTGSNFLRTMLRLAAERDELRVVADQVGSPTPGRADRRRQRAGPARSRPSRSGTWHLTAAGQTSWCGFAEAIFDGAQQRGLIARRAARDPDRHRRLPDAGRSGPHIRCWTPRGCSAISKFVLPSWQDGLGSVLDDIAQDGRLARRNGRNHMGSRECDFWYWPALLLCAGVAQAATAVDVAAFIKRDGFDDIKISPQRRVLRRVGAVARTIRSW